MSKPSGKLEFAYRTIASLEAKVSGTDAELSALRQQLADVSNERDSIRAQLEGIAKDYDALQSKLNASEARNAEAEKLLRELRYLKPSTMNRRIDKHLAQSAPATDEQGAGS